MLKVTYTALSIFLVSVIIGIISLSLTYFCKHP